MRLYEITLSTYKTTKIRFFVHGDSKAHAISRLLHNWLVDSSEMEVLHGDICSIEAMLCNVQ